jgi:molecular chaperone GrpE
MAEKLAAVEKDRDEYLAGWQRAKADFVNYKKDETERLEDLAKYGNANLIKELLGVVHSFDLATRIIEKNKGELNDFEKGVFLIKSQLEDVLKKRGVQLITIKEGDVFDPAIAEAMLEVESDKLPGTVIEVLEPGYRLHDKIMRAAKVTISK